jgi:hypothetical protein
MENFQVATAVEPKCTLPLWCRMFLEEGHQMLPQFRFLAGKTTQLGV